MKLVVQIVAAAAIAQASSAHARPENRTAKALRSQRGGHNGNLKDVRCPQLAMNDLIYNNKIMCDDRNVDYSYNHVYWDIYLQQLPSGIDWHALWLAADQTPFIGFGLCQQDDADDDVGDITLQWQNQGLPTYPHNLNGNPGSDPGGACAPAPVLCPFSAQNCGVGSNGAPNCTNCLQSLVTSDQPKWTIDLHNQNYAANAIAYFGVGVGCVKLTNITDATPFNQDMCTNNKAYYYQIQETGQDVFVTGGCAISNTQCTGSPAGSQYCCADGSPPSGQPKDCSGGAPASCFDCTGLC